MKHASLTSSLLKVTVGRCYLGGIHMHISPRAGSRYRSQRRENKGLEEMTTKREHPVLRLLVLSRMDSVTLFAGHVGRSRQRPRADYDRHLSHIQRIVHGDGIRILNLASHSNTCYDLLRSAELVARKGFPPPRAPDIEPNSFCKALAEFAEEWTADASVAFRAEADATLASRRQLYLFQQPCLRLNPGAAPPATAVDNRLLDTPDYRRVPLARDEGLRMLSVRALLKISRPSINTLCSILCSA